MFTALVTKLEQALAAECAILRFSESLRSAGMSGAAGAPAALPSLTEWKIHDQCGVVVRMYAEYESFFVALIDNWVKRLPVLYPKYSDLPEEIRTQHRIGVATILQKLGADQYAEITESAAAAALSGVLGDQPYSLLADAFWVNCTANIRLDTAKEVIKKVGAGDPSRFLQSMDSLKKVLAEIDSTAEQQLKMLVEARNVASHDDISNVEGIDIHDQRARFLVAFARALAAYFEMLVTEREIIVGVTVRLGRVIHTFSNSVCGFEAAVGGVWITNGAVLLAMTGSECFRAVVESIQVDKVPYDRLETSAGMKIGIKTSPALPMRAALVLLNV